MGPAAIAIHLQSRPIMPRSSTKTPPPAVLTLMATAAELRAGGSSWEKVAARVQRSPETCRKWPAEYPDDWRRLFRQAEERLIVEVSSEAVLTLRNLLRAEDDRIRRDAARSLLNLRVQLSRLEGKLARPGPASTDNDNTRIAAFLASHSDADLQSLTNELLARRQRPGRGPAAAPADAPGPALPE